MTTPVDPSANGPHSRAIDLAGWLSRKGRPTEPAPPPRPSPPPPVASARSGLDRPRRAAAYLATLAPAVSGQKGHCRTFRAACILVKGFNLSTAEARPILEDWNRGCDPPWSDRELEHKLKEADKTPDDRPRGWLLVDRPVAHFDSPRDSNIGRKQSPPPFSPCGRRWPQAG